MSVAPQRASGRGHRLTAAAAALFALLAAGCGSDTETATAPSESVATSTAGASTTPASASAPPPRPYATESPTTEPATDPYADSPLIDHTVWSDDSDGRRLHVYPTAAGRADQFPAAQDRAWAEIVADAPDADSPGMYDQFTCHWVWARLVAPNKPAWNLEPWRPAVGYQATVEAMCNPGGPDTPGN
ncbi:DUF2599 domain-containing protein [Nocardia spumae]|uniref:DUF2599 domain-containing protein n=1 Tax=Nocardia spumae TaxID=2887190 RepID=UPI001D147A98|nr:DUF2599 domain-containing protein [Nocardia spumae]